MGSPVGLLRDSDLSAALHRVIRITIVLNTGVLNTEQSSDPLKTIQNSNAVIEANGIALLWFALGWAIARPRHKALD
jgi:hypothetical protein